ncbi:MucB/RseB C-terminal domain-containing protein [Halioglobus sp. Uisw_031]|uniref:MucB/RseB C-terminal domain-containing protein n=1 Tax=Halioglobus sp. Uisw_031 TaxID=3230977 RepID=UPI0039E8C55F
MTSLSSVSKKLFRYLLLAVFSVSTSVGANAASCPDDNAVALSWLDKMSRSLRQANYHGVVTLQRDGDMQVMQVSHIVGDGSSSERLVELTGRGAQVERLSHPLDCIHPGDRLLRGEALLPEKSCGIATHYRFAVTPGERVAGREVVRIVIEPRDMYRFGYVVDLDEETGIMLKAQTIGHGHKILETMQFANIVYSDNLPEFSQADVIHTAQHLDPQSASAQDPVTRAWNIGWLPLGFAATGPSTGTSERRTYTDGFAVFSVFLEELNVEVRAGEGLVKRGGTTSYTRGMRIDEQPVLVTVIGEVPVNTARMVADSLDWLP